MTRGSEPTPNKAQVSSQVPRVRRPTGPYYDDGQVTIYHADLRDLADASWLVACVVTSPPYNVGVAYDGHNDRMPWPEYWELASSAATTMGRWLEHGGRCWVNTAVSVPQEPTVPTGGAPGSNGKRRILVANRWANILAEASLSLIDQIAWCSPRGAGTAWGSWQSPTSPNLRGDWEAITVACKGDWERSSPHDRAGWRDTIGNWQSLCSTVWNLTPERRNGDHPVPYPVELARRCIRLSTWPGETVLDPFMGSGSTLVAARDLGRRAIGVETSERYCETAARRLSQGALDLGGAA